MQTEDILIDEIEFYLDPVQASIADWYLRSLSKILCTIGCRGAGKSALIRTLIFMSSIASKKQILYASQSNGNSMDQFNKIIENETVQEYLYQGTDQEAYTTKPYPTIRWNNGSTTIFWAMEEKNSKRGLHPSEIYIDEAQSVSRPAWSRILYPMRKRFGGDAKILVFGSCPETDANWFWEMYQDGKTYPNKRDAKSFTMDINTSLTFKGDSGKAFLEEARANMSEHDFESEFKLKPGGQGDYYLNHADIEACIAAFKQEDVDESNGTIMAYDPALGRQDPAAYTICDLKGNFFLSHSIPKDLTDVEQIDDVVQASKAHRSLVVVESNATPWMTYAGALKKLLPHGVKDVPLRGISTKSHEAKNVLYKQLAWYLENRMIRISPQCIGLIKQLKSLRDYKSPTGALQIKAPDRDHDDEASCCCIAVEALNKKWKPYLNGGRNFAMGLL